MKPPIFIVGVPRSGTTLLAAMLAAHSHLSCGPETGFFRRLAAVNPDALCDAASWPQAAVNFLAGIKHTGYGQYTEKRLLEKYRLEPRQIESFLAEKTPAIPNILAAVTEQYMAAAGKIRWIEKTPDHIQYLPGLRRYFPDSPVIHIVRDPRDVALSLTKMPWGAQSFFEALFFWRRFEGAGSEFLAADERSYVLRFEDLLATPRETLTDLCRFIGEEFEPQMLDTSGTGKSVNSRGVPWKAKASQPIDKSRIAAWRKSISAAENKVAEAIVGDRMDFYGYPRDESFRYAAEVYPDFSLAIKYRERFSALTVQQSICYWRTPPPMAQPATVYLGEPAADHWFDGESAGKWAQMWAVAKKLIRPRNAVFWLAPAEKYGWTGVGAQAIKFLLRRKSEWANSE